MDSALQTLGLRPAQPTAYDRPLLQKALAGVDGLGRTNPNYQYTGGGVNWLHPEHGHLRRQLVGQVGKVNSYFAKKAAALPWLLYRTGKDRKPELLPSPPLLDLLWQPNPLTGQVVFMRQISILYHGQGNVFIWANRLDSGVNAGKPTELWILPTPNVKPLGGTVMQAPTKYVFTPDLSKPGETIDLLPEDVLHLKHDALPGETYGVGCIVAANREATADQASITAQVSQMQNQGPAGILSFEPVDNRPVELGPNVVSDMRNRLATHYTGADKRGSFPIMTQAVKWTAIGATAVDLDIIQFREANFREICGYWGVPSELLGDKVASTYNNVGEARKAFYTDGVLPYLEAILPEFSRWLCPMFEKGTWLQVDTSGVPELQADKKAETERIMSMYLLPIERRVEMLGETPDKNFTGYLIPAGLVHVKSLDELGGPAAAAKLLRRHGYTDYPGAGEGDEGWGTKAANKTDVGFAQDMVPHHKMAVKMADKEIAKGDDPDLVKLAKKIKQGQSAEIEFLEAWLKQHGETPHAGMNM
ncbi:phage portal protein [Hymenobacter sp. BT491]|uniref:phage portal protein n=1 Tax=Hymenobacter sp. BT491 TaxID=2766779 RepID=UPI0016538590|nr:phage portal protein [Hymenobacter sp. BT491]MBC6988954.1 phage portal protein [Hymenobacter sp. BT491]